MESKDRLTEKLQDAYTVPEPRPELESRLNRMAVEAGVPKRSKMTVLRVMLLGIALLAVVGFAYNALFRRTGEAAIALIPSDASLVVTVDLVPSEGQVLAFKKIGDALKREGLDGKLEEAIGSGTQNDKEFIRKLRPYMSNNFAFAEWNSGNAQETHAMLWPVNDTRAVEQIIAGFGSKINQPGIAYRMRPQAQGGLVRPGDNETVGIIGEYLVATNSDALFRRIALARDGAGQTVAQLPAYQEARAALPSDANLMVFVSPTAMSEASKAAGMKTVKAPKWMCFGAAVRDNGIRIDFRSPLEKEMAPGAAYTTRLDANLLRRLPSGALGLTTLADPGASISWINKKVGNEKAVSDTVDVFEKESGLNLERDIYPALRGTAAIAVYPGATSEGMDLEAVMLFTGDNGAKPAELAAKIQALIQRDSAKDAKPVKFVQTNYSGATVWTLDASAQKEIGATAKEMGIGNKELMWATIDNSVILASSKAMLFKAIRSYRGANVLAEDAAFASMATQLSEKSQFATMISIRRVMQRMSSSLGKEEGMDWVKVFGGENDGLVISGYLEGDVIVGSALIPIDYDEAAKAAKKAWSEIPSPESDLTDGDGHASHSNHAE